MFIMSRTLISQTSVELLGWVKGFTSGDSWMPTKLFPKGYHYLYPPESDVEIIVVLNVPDDLGGLNGCLVYIGSPKFGGIPCFGVCNIVQLQTLVDTLQYSSPISRERHSKHLQFLTGEDAQHGKSD